MNNPFTVKTERKNSSYGSCHICAKHLGPSDMWYWVKRVDEIRGAHGTLLKLLTCSEECATMCILKYMDDPYTWTHSVFTMDGVTA